MALRGRPRDEAREIATVLGDRFYEGSPCSICANTVRYTAGGACAACGVRRNEAYRDKMNPDRKRQPRLLTVSEHAIEAAQALDGFGEALVDHDLLEGIKEPWE